MLSILITRITRMSLKAKHKICATGLDLLRKTWVQETIQHLVFLNRLKSAMSLLLLWWVKMEPVSSQTKCVKTVA